MHTYLETERLVLRRFTEQDADLLFALHNDPDVMRYLNGGKPVPREQIVEETLPRFIRSGFFAAFGKPAGDFLGWFLLRPPEGGPADEPELGYRLHKAAWGRGYATEGSLALIDKAFGELGARRVFAQTMAVNLGSRRVMEKCGLRYVRTFFEDWADPIDGAEEGEVEYEVRREDWLARRRASTSTSTSTSTSASS
ncbi:GNAT family N-acetyltransferase [Actinomadura sp. ATCC 31491]|uniref:GNAT family N-acetyltransferase n=1 Tax=Actinomadura luzonensis TaxID=2805427 RepID=A0ABT0G3W7_9ACTN|nr:GNAT family N-acetyltransferase [Actinomadura luzonensis]MCK2219108.1 GNAT family N-acetyltransferase [Actinomadura luzonensis]